MSVCLFVCLFVFLFVCLVVCGCLFASVACCFFLCVLFAVCLLACLFACFLSCWSVSAGLRVCLLVACWFLRAASHVCSSCRQGRRCWACSESGKEYTFRATRKTWPRWSTFFFLGSSFGFLQLARHLGHNRIFATHLLLGYCVYVLSCKTDSKHPWASVVCMCVCVPCMLLECSKGPRSWFLRVHVQCREHHDSTLLSPRSLWPFPYHQLPPFLW